MSLPTLILEPFLNTAGDAAQIPETQPRQNQHFTKRSNKKRQKRKNGASSSWITIKQTEICLG